VIRVTTRLVEVSVVARDKDGPVRDLTKADFSIVEKGKDHPIAFFSMHTAGAPVAPGATAAAKLPPNVFANRPQTGAPGSLNVTVVLLDGINTQIRDQHYAKQQFLKFIRQIRPEDRVAVYTLGAKLRVLSDFTNDTGRLERLIGKYKGTAMDIVEGSQPDLADTGDDLMDDWLNESAGVYADAAIEMRVAHTAAALQTIAAHIAHIPGRKNLVWISGSFPFSIGHGNADGPSNWEEQAYSDSIARPGQRGRSAGGPSQGAALYEANLRDGSPSRDRATFDREVKRATDALNNANISVYPVDARGLMIPKSMTAEGNTPISINRLSQAPNTSTLTMPGHNSMRAIADATGGIVFENTNDLRGAIRAAIDDSEVTYTLGFYPDSDSVDEKFHDIKVHVKRKGVELRYRQGYVASNAAPPSDQERALLLKEATTSPLDATALTLTALLEPAPPKSLKFTVAVQTPELALEGKDGKFTGGVEIIFTQRSAAGVELGVARQALGIDVDRERYEKLMKGFTITKTIDPKPGLAEVRIVLVDRASGKIGSLTVPVK
jgi:VWFA-related protein